MHVAGGTPDDLLSAWRRLRAAGRRHAAVLAAAGVGVVVDERQRIRVNARRVGLQVRRLVGGGGEVPHRGAVEACRGREEAGRAAPIKAMVKDQQWGTGRRGKEAAAGGAVEWSGRCGGGGQATLVEVAKQHRWRRMAG